MGGWKSGSLGINKVHGNLSKEKIIGKLQGYSFCGSIRQCFPGSSGVDVILQGKKKVSTTGLPPCSF
jgi:hypothetical protein